MSENKKLNRRKFFGLTSLTILGFSLFSGTPLKYFDRSKRINTQAKVKIHPSAVKRNK